MEVFLQEGAAGKLRSAANRFTKFPVLIVSVLPGTGMLLASAVVVLPKQAARPAAKSDPTCMRFQNECFREPKPKQDSAESNSLEA